MSVQTNFVPESDQAKVRSYMSAHISPQCFERMLRVAIELKLPVIVDKVEPAGYIWEKYRPKLKRVVYMLSDTRMKLSNLDHTAEDYFMFDPIITYDSLHETRDELIRSIPTSRLLICSNGPEHIPSSPATKLSTTHPGFNQLALPILADVHKTTIPKISSLLVSNFDAAFCSPM